MTPDPALTPAEFAEAMDATWPPFASHRLGPWRIREGGGGGKRVSAASAEGDWHDADIAGAEEAMQAWGQDPLFAIWPWDQALDDALALRGYEKIDPVLAYAAPVSALPAPAWLTSFPHWPPMAIARDIWAEGHIGPGRLAVMERAVAPKTCILGRSGDRPAGAAFVSIHGQVALIHAVEVRGAARRKGAGRALVCAAAHWAAEQGADRLALAVTEANSAARALYASLGMQVVGRYHYRKR